MESREFVLETMKQYGKGLALNLQNKSSEMSGTALNAQADYIPDFKAAVAVMNMLNRKADRYEGFICRSSAGRVVRLIQNYDSDIYISEPEELAAQFAFVWSNDPAHALPFIAISTSPYMEGNCCSEEGLVYRSTMNDNVFAPSAYPQGWELVT